MIGTPDSHMPNTRLIFAAIAALFFSIARIHASPTLFEWTDVPVQAHIMNAIWEMPVAVHPALLAEGATDTLTVHLDGAVVTLIRDRIDRRSLTNWSWFGKVAGYSPSDVVLLIDRNRVMGGIHFGGKNFRVRPVDDGLGILGCVPDTYADPDGVIEPMTQDASASATASSTVPNAPQTVTVNLLFLYTQNASNNAVATWGMSIANVVQQATDYANQACINSQVAHRYAGGSHRQAMYAAQTTRTTRDQGNFSFSAHCSTPSIIFEKTPSGLTTETAS